jgi:hypothetical protein
MTVQQRNDVVAVLPSFKQAGWLYCCFIKDKPYFFLAFFTTTSPYINP